MIDRLLRLTMTGILLTSTVPVLMAQKDDVENIGNRDINPSGPLGLGNINFSSLEEEIALGRAFAADLERQVQLVDDPVINEYVNRVGQNLVRNSDARIPFSFKVIEDDSINAMALPGGFVYINTGIIMAADEEAELAGVLAHEIAHVTARHGTENQSKATLLNILSLPLIFVGGVPGIALQQAASIAIPSAFYKFSRSAEEEADYLGTQYMYKAGYDPSAAVSFFEKIQARETARPGSVSTIFASHPPTGSRIEKTKASIAEVLPEREQYVLSTSEFDDVRRLMVAYYNRIPAEDEDDAGPSLRRQTQRPDASTDADETVEADAGPPRLERSGGGSDPEPAENADPDRPVLRRPEGSNSDL
jgi:predicted Zn-dependent protease